MTLSLHCCFPAAFVDSRVVEVTAAAGPGRPLSQHFCFSCFHSLIPHQCSLGLGWDVSLVLRADLHNLLRCILWLRMASILVMTPVCHMFLTPADPWSVGYGLLSKFSGQGGQNILFPLGPCRGPQTECSSLLTKVNALTNSPSSVRRHVPESAGTSSQCCSGSLGL